MAYIIYAVMIQNQSEQNMRSLGDRLKDYVAICFMVILVISVSSVVVSLIHLIYLRHKVLDANEIQSLVATLRECEDKVKLIGSTLDKIIPIDGLDGWLMLQNCDSSTKQRHLVLQQKQSIDSYKRTYKNPE